MKKIIFLIISLVMVNYAYSYRFEFCELARNLHFQQRYPKHELPDWLCLIKAESGMETNITGHENKDGSTDFGLFQINNKFWCHDPSYDDAESNGCNIDCSELLTNNIDVASRCARYIYEEYNYTFRPWSAWVSHCQGQHLEGIEKCFERHETQGHWGHHSRNEF